MQIEITAHVPAAITMADARKLKKAKEKTGLVYMMHESSYYRQPCIAARELYQAGEFGWFACSEVEYYRVDARCPGGLGDRTRSACSACIDLNSSTILSTS